MFCMLIDHVVVSIAVEYEFCPGFHEINAFTICALAICWLLMIVVVFALDDLSSE